MRYRHAVHIFPVASLAVCLLLLPVAPAEVAATPGEIIIGTTDFPTSLDPAGAADYPSWELLNHLYTGLTRQIAGTLTYELALAAEHTISDDGLQHTFTLRDNITFDDGTPITAATFVSAINRVISLGQEGASYINRYIDRVMEGEGNSVIFTLLMPLPDFEAIVALPMFFPQHPDSYPADDILPLQNAGQLITNGQYRLELWSPNEIILVPNPAYDGPPPANDRVILRRYNLPIDLRRALEAHEIDVAWRGLAVPDLEAARQNPYLVTQEQANLHMYYMLFNHNITSVGNMSSLNDLALRHGIALLLQRERAAETGYHSTVIPRDTLLPPEMLPDQVTFPAYDRHQADETLTEGGYRPRRRPVHTAILISTETYGDAMRTAAAELARGLNESVIVEMPAVTDNLTPTFINAVNRGEYLAAIIGWNPLYTSPAGYLIPLAWSGAPIPAGAGYGNDEIDRLLAAASLSTDRQEQEALYAQILALLRDQYDLVPLWQGEDAISYWGDISGVLVETNSWLRYSGLHRN